MPIQLAKVNGGNVLAVHLTGRLTKADYAPFLTEFERLVERYGELRVLFDMTGLDGWVDGGIWEDIDFDIARFAAVERVATIGDREWQQGATELFQPFSKATIRHFAPTEKAGARSWLIEA